MGYYYLLIESDKQLISNRRGITLIGVSHSSIYFRTREGTILIYKIFDLLHAFYSHKNDKEIVDDYVIRLHDDNDGVVNPSKTSIVKSKITSSADITQEKVCAEEVLGFSSLAKVCSNSDSLFVLTSKSELVQLHQSDPNRGHNTILLNKFDMQQLDTIYIAATDFRCMAIVKNNVLLDNEYKTELYKFRDNVQSFSAGKDFYVVLLSDGSLWSFGNGLRGQLGLNNLSCQKIPQQIYVNTEDEDANDEEEKSIFVSNVYCGGWHVFALTECHQRIYSWGWNSNGQTGIDDTLRCVQPFPTELPKFTEKITNISLGSRHSSIKLQNGDIFCFGFNKLGQCGQKRSEYVNLAAISHPSTKNNSLLSNIKHGDIICSGLITIVYFKDL
ncbi:hypothetical protein GJ496_010492 [Pomphorhynchus laevis]|nr:hypothetical protein GJ496_010492 [Pomphorhynchus laevis]